MEKENNCFDAARIERGIVVSVSSGLYQIRSYGRDGLVTPGIPALAGGGQPYAVNEKVYFFLFDDGTGAVLGRFS